MNVVAFDGSPRRDGNTAILIHHVLAAVDGHGIAAEVVQVVTTDGPGAGLAG